MNWIEVLAIKRAIQSYRCYSESDETVYVDGYSVSFRYQDLSCTITIRGNGHLRVRTLEFDDIEDEVIEDMIGVNLMGAFWSNRAAARIMLAQGEGGKIINFASAIGFNGLAKRCGYAASKGGVMSLVKSLAKELGPHNINVNAVAPGIVLRDDQNQGNALKTNVFGRKCVAEDITNLVEFLASDKASYITGQTYVIDGGRSLSLKGTD